MAVSIKRADLAGWLNRGGCEVEDIRERWHIPVQDTHLFGETAKEETHCSAGGFVSLLFAKPLF